MFYTDTHTHTQTHPERNVSFDVGCRWTVDFYGFKLIKAIFMQVFNPKVSAWKLSNRFSLELRGFNLRVFFLSVCITLFIAGTLLSSSQELCWMLSIRVKSSPTPGNLGSLFLEQRGETHHEDFPSLPEAWLWHKTCDLTWLSQNLVYLRQMFKFTQ